ncbi:uncharacterized protein At4g08330, chloroplastic-like [Diospyros lotus]|uniref:uncharacterized protein At4g08330, chloroplastic-like n=1 Tax=Diospyros lotus TaxID=55363 RepID=UPI002250C90C|nr:uncharacterized protein At4g08330, chloroplastic-like [Diospyros lotus]
MDLEKKMNGRPKPILAGVDYPTGTEDLLQLSLSSPACRDVNYSCGSCGYNLNLNSCNRNTSVIGAKYGKSIKKGIISFFSIDESRFSQIDELQFMPFFTSKRFWGLFRQRTKLLCRKCGSLIGIAYSENSNFYTVKTGKQDLTSWDGISGHKTYDIKIHALQPSFSRDSGIFM